jgi:hypothetical protein
VDFVSVVIWANFSLEKRCRGKWVFLTVFFYNKERERDSGESAEYWRKFGLMFITVKIP